jgi:hypothetical protein
MAVRPMITWFAAAVLYSAIIAIVDQTTADAYGDGSPRDSRLLDAAQVDLLHLMLESGGR